MQISFTFNIKLRIQYKTGRSSTVDVRTVCGTDHLLNPDKEPKMAEKVLPKFEAEQRDNREFTKKH